VEPQREAGDGAVQLGDAAGVALLGPPAVAQQIRLRGAHGVRLALEFGQLADHAQDRRDIPGLSVADMDLGHEQPQSTTGRNGMKPVT